MRHWMIALTRGLGRMTAAAFCVAHCASAQEGSGIDVYGIELPEGEVGEGTLTLSWAVTAGVRIKTSKGESVEDIVRRLYNGRLTWELDDPPENNHFDEDVMATKGRPNIYTIDTPGIVAPSDHFADPTVVRLMKKGKFREWVEVTYGGKTFVVSSYLEWHTLLHMQWSSVGGFFIEDLADDKKTRILKGDGGLSGFAGGDNGSATGGNPWPGGWQNGYY